MKYKALIKDPDQEIKWLTIESDEEDTKGFFVYYHIRENFAYDTWHESLDKAFEAGTEYGIKKEDWENISNE